MVKLLVPHVPPLEAVIPYLKKVHAARWFTNFGRLVEELEDRLSRRYAARVVTCSSATAGLELSYRMLAQYGMMEARLTPWSFPAAALAAKRAGLKVTLRDPDPSTWTDGSVAALGVPVEEDRAADNPVVDAAAAFGTQGHLPGSLTVVSLHATKPLPGIEGGFVVCNSADEAAELRRMSNFGFLDTTRTAPYQHGHLTPVGFGTNAKLSEYHAAVALASLDAWPAIRAKYFDLQRLYLPRLPETVELQAGRRLNEAYPVLAVLLPEGVYADYVFRRMKSEGIETRRWYSPPLYRHSMFGAAAEEFPVARRLEERVLGLPWHLHLTEDEVDRTCTALGRILEEL